MEALDDVQFIANSIRLFRGALSPCFSFDFLPRFADAMFLCDSDRSRFAIITGPNMGGKSTYIRMARMLPLLLCTISPVALRPGWWS
jgi:DNA mismatch repair ATPase MutS